MTDELFHRRPEETVAQWHARLAAMELAALSCHQRERRKLWLDMAREAARRERRGPREANP
jgi:hypothetical protein